MTNFTDVAIEECRKRFEAGEVKALLDALEGLLLVRQDEGPVEPRIELRDERTVRRSDRRQPQTRGLGQEGR